MMGPSVRAELAEMVGLGAAQANPAAPYAPVIVGCAAYNPSKISHFTLFDQMNNTRWKGCVETRPPPFDVTDAAPSSANPNTKFVPYFWMDDADYNNRFVNNYMRDGTPPGGPGFQWEGRWGQTYSVFKYVRGPINRDDTPPATLGPNQSCPDEVQPLTDVRGQVISKIAQLRHWEGSGTNNLEGLMWGWRVLSPSEPFTQGAPYGEAKKILVIMSDGLNNAVQNPNDAVMTDYTSMNQLRLWERGGWGSIDGAPALPIRNRTEFQNYMTGRFDLACRNAKAAGIEIYTVLFRESDQQTVRAFRDCATDPSKAFRASSSNDLVAVFGAIADSIAKLRLTQ